MSEFLSLLSPGEALSTLLAHLPAGSPASEWIETAQALGRVLREPVYSPHPLPAFPRSTVDGYAVQARDTHGASDSLPAYLTLVGEVPMGRQPDFLLGQAQSALIHTGGMLPPGADAVVMVEHTQSAREAEIEILRAVAAGENVLRVGEDVAEGEEVLRAGCRLRPAEIGGLMAIGQMQVVVSVPVRVGILSSGDEVISPSEEPKPGQVRDINSFSLSALVEQAGATPHRYGIVSDQPDLLREAIAGGLLENDMLVITAGSSASTRDLTAQIIAEMGEPGVLVHGVNVRPGKPTILAVCAGKAVIGLPGNPVSALVIARLFVVPVIERLSGLRIEPARPVVSARLTINLPSQAGREDWIPVRLFTQEGDRCVEPVFFKSNLIFNLVKADGLVHIPADITGLNAGETVEVYLI